MQATVSVIRAVGAEFARRMFGPIAIAGAVLAVALLLLGGLLITQSAWWWILEVVFILWTLLFIALALVVQTIIKVADVPKTKEQKRAVKAYVSKLQRASENLQTPHFIIFYRVVRDTMRPRQDGFIETISQDSKSLAPDFVKLVKFFQ